MECPVALELRVYLRPGSVCSEGDWIEPCETQHQKEGDGKHDVRDPIHEKMQAL
jgi:hypothetical protein